MKKGLAAVMLFTVGIPLLLAAAGGAQTKTTLVTIGTGGPSGLYHPAGNAIAKRVNAKGDLYGIRAAVDATDGPVSTIDAIGSGALAFGVVPSDLLHQAVNGIGAWQEKGPWEDLRAVFSIHAENVDLIAAVDAGIDSFQDLKGKRVGLGEPGSGLRRNAIDALVADGLNWKTDVKAESLAPEEAPGRIQDGRIDAAFCTAAHPSGYYVEATTGGRKVKFIPMPNVDRIVARHPYYARSVTRIKHYPGAVNTSDIPTFGVKATFATSARVSDEVVYAFTREVFEHLEGFAKLHPAFAGLTRTGMLEGLAAPIHPGALTYFQEVGLRR